MKAVIAIDGHGGDHGLSVTLPAAINALESDPSIEIQFFGVESKIDDLLARDTALRDSLSSPGERFSFHHVESCLPMDVRAVSALRRGQGSSLWEAIAQVAGNSADACVSGGNTGAMMALGVRQAGMIPGIERPVLMAYVPHSDGFTAALDLGANLSVNERQLVQFAVMGSVKAEHIDGIENPRVGLLNVGHEESKGTVTVQAAHQLLKEMPVNYIGFVEGNDLFTGKADVAVCDGFSGNLILKSSEGLARMAMETLQRSFKSSLRGRLGALLARPALESVLASMDPSAHNGAPLLGLRGIVVKSHGHANARAYTEAIMEAAQSARKQLPQKIDSLIQKYNLEA